MVPVDQTSNNRRTLSFDPVNKIIPADKPFSTIVWFPRQEDSLGLSIVYQQFSLIFFVDLEISKNHD